jgi:acyl-CoA synthetase (AMP-forming)/AMP-acid ligase II
MPLPTVPLVLAAPAAAASLAYLDARTGFSYDYRLLGSAFYTGFKVSLKERSQRLSVFYMLEDHALGKRGNDRALVFEGRQWTYKEVYDTVLKYGTWMKKKYNIKPKEIVAMDFMNSEKFLFVWLGLWAIGAKPAFINYNLTGKALSHCIRVSASRLCLFDPQIQQHVTQEVLDDLPGVQFEAFSPELEAEVMATNAVREKDSVRAEDKSQNMAILIYTSGTTGLPKGAVVSWNKILVGGGLVPPWMNFTHKDTFYTVSQPPPPFTCHALTQLVYASIPFLCLGPWIL